MSYEKLLKKMYKILFDDFGLNENQSVGFTKLMKLRISKVTTKTILLTCLII